METTHRMIAYVQVLMSLSPPAPTFARLERIEHYLIRRYNRGVF